MTTISSQPPSSVPIIRNKAFVSTIEVIGVCEMMIDGFDEPVKVTVRAEKDSRTNQYRSFDVKVDAPKAMKARFRRRMPANDTIVVP